MSLVRRFLRAYRSTDAVKVLPLELDRDWAAIERLLTLEEWPFVRTDLEVGHAQPHAACFVAYVAGELAGFFTTHHFDDVGYYDMFIVDEAHRNGPVAHALFATGDAALQTHTSGTVVHSTLDSAPFIRRLGFEPGASYTLLVRPPSAITNTPMPTPDRQLLLDTDREVFGKPRTAWIDALLTHPRVQTVQHGQATAFLRPRAENALAIDVCSPDPSQLDGLIGGIVQLAGDRVLQCFARTDGRLHRTLAEQGFVVPDFFVAIGPLVEWRQGETHDLGTSDKVECLMWL